MAAKSKKRLSKIENKLLKLEKLELKDVVCSICQSILIEPVTLPCFHYFCRGCFNGSVENNALCCPLCRLRIGSWLRTATKQKNLVNTELWNFIKSKFSQEIETKLKGDDINLPEEKPFIRISTPGEIRSEYEAELRRLRAERLRLEQRHIQETELLIKKLQLEEEEAHKKYLENVKQDEILALQIQHEHSKDSTPTQKSPKKHIVRTVAAKPRLKATKIDNYLTKIQTPPTSKDSPVITDDNASTDGSTPRAPIINASTDGSTPRAPIINASTDGSTPRAPIINANTDGSTPRASTVNASTDGSTPRALTVNASTDGSTPRAPTVKPINGTSPEMVPGYGKLIRSFIDKKIKLTPGLWNKENGEAKDKKEKEEPQKSCSKDTDCTAKKAKVKSSIPSLLVSLPYTGILQHKINAAENRNKETGSVDSMRQELCYFKPIEAITSKRSKSHKCIPLRVPGLRVDKQSRSEPQEASPTRAQYLDGLCQLRNLSLARNLPSAFVIALNILKVNKKESSSKCETDRSKIKKTATSPGLASELPIKKITSRNNKTNHVDGISTLSKKSKLRRTKSMGSISKDDNETTPRKSKVKERKVSSERKPYLRSDSKKSSTKKEAHSPPLISETLNNNKVNVAVKNLSSPLKNCDVKKILQEQLRIEKLIEQEKNDFEFAQKMDAELNGRRHPRRATFKRQVTLNYDPRPAKKLKV